METIAILDLLDRNFCVIFLGLFYIISSCKFTEFFHGKIVIIGMYYREDTQVPLVYKDTCVCNVNIFIL